MPRGATSRAVCCLPVATARPARPPSPGLAPPPAAALRRCRAPPTPAPPRQRCVRRYSLGLTHLQGEPDGIVRRDASSGNQGRLDALDAPT
eukprot:5765799-Pleurochrysis_carterae.AAC.1